MIRVKVTYQKEIVTSLTVSGHANSGEYGKDLVCAGVSAVVVGGLNSLKNHSNFTIDIKDGYVNVKANTLPSNPDHIVLDTIVTSLLTIEQNYRKYIKITQERTD